MSILKSSSFKSISDSHAVWLIHKLAEDVGFLATDTVSVWFSQEKMKALVDDLTTNNCDGVRIYFGKYPSKYPGLPNELKGKKTLILVPTKANPLNPKSHIDTVTQSRCRKIIDDEIPVMDTLDLQAFEIENHGELCPPNSQCDGANIGNEVYDNIP